MTNHLPTKSPDDQSIDEHPQPISGHKTAEVNTPQGDELRDEISMYVESAYLHGLCVENLDTGKLEPPRDISDVAWITDNLMHLITAETDKAVAEARIEENTACQNIIQSKWGTNDQLWDMQDRIKTLRSVQPNQGEKK